MVSRTFVRLTRASGSQHRTEPHGESHETSQRHRHHEPSLGDLRLQSCFYLTVRALWNLSARTTLLDGRSQPTCKDRRLVETAKRENHRLRTGKKHSHRDRRANTRLSSREKPRISVQPSHYSMSPILLRQRTCRVCICLP